MAKSRIKGITVEIGGDTTKLQDALKGVNKNIRDTQSELKDVNRMLKLDPGNSELLAQKQKLLGDAVGQTKEKLDALKQAAAQANDALSEGKISQQQYDALQREIIETEQTLKDLESQADSSATAIEKIGNAGSNMQKVGGALTGAGKAMLPVTGVITGAGAAAVKTAADFESSMSQVQATLGIPKDAMSQLDGQSVNTMEALSALAKEMGSTTAFSATECAEALNYLALAGYNTQQMAGTLPMVLDLAAAGGIDLAQASDMVTDAMSALDISTSEAQGMVDQMARTSSTTNTSVAQLGDGILTIGATARSVKGGTEELNTALGILANNGIKGAEGGTHLRNIIMSLQNPTSKATNAMEELGLQVYDSEGNMRSMNDILGDLQSKMNSMTGEEQAGIISKLFNKTDAAAAQALIANTGAAWENLQADIANSGGAAGDMAATQMDNLNGQITILKSSLEGLSISLGETLLPHITTIVQGIQGFLDWLNSLDEGTKNVIVTILLVVAAIGPVLIIVGQLISSVGTIMTVLPMLSGALSVVGGAFSSLFAIMAANPLGLLVIAIGILIAWFMHMWDTSESFRNFWIGLWDSIKTTVMNVVSKAAEWGRDLINGFINGIKSKIEAFKNTISGIAGTIRSFLHFSVPDEGPLTDYETWMPDFVDGLAKGIEKNRGKIRSAMGGLTSDMVIRPDGLPSPTVAGGVSGSSVVHLTQPVQIGGKTITTIVSEIQYTNGRIKARNLGR